MMFNIFYMSLSIILLFPVYIVGENDDNNVGPRCLRISETGHFGDCHDRFKVDKDARCLDLSRKSLEDLPSNLAECLPNIKEIDLSFNQYEEVPTRALRGLTELHHLKMDNNLIKSLADALLGLRGLTRISFASNLIEEIPKDVFYLPHLKILDFTNNSITVLPCSEENNYTVISEVSLRNNSVRDLNISCIAQLNNVTGITANDSMVKVTRVGDNPLEIMIGGNRDSISCERNVIEFFNSSLRLALDVSCRFENGTFGKLLITENKRTTTISSYVEDDGYKKENNIKDSPSHNDIILTVSVLTVLSICVWIWLYRDVHYGNNER